MTNATGNGVCFVISPIGDEGSPEKRHADRIFRFIIKPAMEKCRLTPERSDHVPEPGKISDRMFSSIVGAELCIAVLTDVHGLYNPNVFYELAIAHAAARPVILLVAKGVAVPFDIADHQYVDYDITDVEGLTDGLYASEVVAHVEGFRKSRTTPRVPFRPDLNPLGSTSDEGIRFVLNTEEFGKSEDWMRLLGEAEREFQIMGLDLYTWRATTAEGKGFTELLGEKADSGCQVKMLLMHPDNPSFGHIISERAWKEPVAAFASRATEIFTFFKDVSLAHPNIEIRQIERGCTLCQLTLTDQKATFIPYLFSQRSSYSPMWACEAGHPLYDKLRNEFQTLWDANGP